MKQELIHIIKLSENASQSNFVHKKPSFNKPLISKKTQPLQLPRFFSSDQKYNKNSLLIARTETEMKEQVNHKNKTISKKEQSKYSKTEKKETPPKIQSSMKQIKIVQQYKRNYMSTGPESKQEFRKGNTLRKTQIIDQIISIEQMNEFKLKSNTKKQGEPNFNNQNKIKYKIGLNKKEQKQKKGIQKIVQYHISETEGNKDRQSLPKANRLAKIMTEQTSVQKHGDTISRVSIKNQDLFRQYIKQTTSFSTQMRIGNKNKLTLKTLKLGKGEINYLQLVLNLLQNTIKMPNNLNFVQSYIVNQKIKHEALISTFFQPKYKSHFQSQIFYSRITYYLLANFILFSIGAKCFSAILQKILQNHPLVSPPRSFSSIKVLFIEECLFAKNKTKISGGIEFVCLKQRQQFESKHLNNQTNDRIHVFVFSISINKKNFPHHQLFLTQISNYSIAKITFEQITLLDKTLKWEVLKMPTYPFLPECEASHHHYLILDLDETLIHFEPEKNLFHVRPYTQEFLVNLSKFFEVTIFTAATKEYADEIINQIDKSGVVKHRLYRNHLTFLEGESIKDISMLGRNLKTTLIIDNLESNFRLHSNHGIAIKSWYGSNGDNILQKLESLLLKMVKEFPEDLREGLKKYQSFIDRQICQRGTIKVKYKI